MRIILGGRYLLDMQALSNIKEVESFGGFPNRKYKVLGEPTELLIVPDADVVSPEEAKPLEEQIASKSLKEKETECIKLKLELSREKAITRISLEKKGISREEIAEYVASETYYWTLDNATSEDVRKYLNKKKEKNLG